MNALTDPSVPPDDSRGAAAAELWLRHVVAWSAGLTDDLPEIDPADAARLEERARGERVLGLVLAAIDAGGLKLPSEVEDRVVEGHEDAMRWCLRVERRMLEVRDWFDQAGVRRWLVLKGSACAHLDEPDPSLRAFADLDLLVASDDFDTAIRALEQRGIERRLPERRPGFDRRIGRSVGMKSPDGVEIDVHRTLAAGGLGLRIPLDDLFADADRFTLGGTTVQALSYDHRALHAAYHAIVGTITPDLRTTRDLAVHLARRDSDPARLSAEAARWGATTVLHDATAAVLDALPIDLPGWRAWMNCAPVEEHDRRLVTATRIETRAPFDRGILEELSPTDRLRYLWAVMFPSRKFLASRGESPSERIRRGTSAWRRQMSSR